MILTNVSGTIHADLRFRRGVFNAPRYRKGASDFIWSRDIGTGCPEKFDTQVFCNKIGNKHGMSKIQASLYSKLNGKASDVSYKHLH